jgi:hypothetical protein
MKYSEAVKARAKEKAERKTAKRKVTVFLTVVFLLYACTKFRIISCGDAWFPVFTIYGEHSWTLCPKTLYPPQGVIHMPAFTRIRFEADSGLLGLLHGNLTSITNADKDVQYDLVVWGNKLNDDMYFIDFGGEAVTNFSVADGTPQKFILAGMELYVRQLAFNWYPRDSDGDYDYLEIFDFAPIELSDGTRITPATEGNSSKRSQFRAFFLRLLPGIWKLYPIYRDGRNFIIAKNPAWKEPKHLVFMTFEENWGKLLEYRVAEE